MQNTSLAFGILTLKLTFPHFYILVFRDLKTCVVREQEYNVLNSSFDRAFLKIVSI